MRISHLALPIIAAMVLTGASGSAQTPSASSTSDNGAPYTLSDGSVARTYDHCGDADLCATIDYPSGERLSFFSEGAALDQPYILHVVHTNAKGTVFEYSRRIDQWHHERLTLDHGNVHLDIDAINDGTLHFTFSSAKPS